MNILLACDSNYYSTWAVKCIKSIQRFAPWINIVTVVVNPENIEEIPKVQYIYDYVDFSSNDSAIAYYQAVRFIKCYEIFSNNELVMSIDCDTVLTKSFTKNDFHLVCTDIHVQRHHKADRWMAGLVTYGNDNQFRKKLKDELLQLPLNQWQYGWDQKVLNRLAAEFEYKKLEVGDWMSFGKGNGLFLTLKGDQKTSPKYLDNFNKISL